MQEKKLSSTITICEPRTAEALSGHCLYHQAIARMSSGAIDLVTLDAADDLTDVLAQNSGAKLILDALWLRDPGFSLPEVAGAVSYLVHSVAGLPDTAWSHLHAAQKVIVTHTSLIEELAARGITSLLVEPAFDGRLKPLPPQPREHDLLRLLTVADIVPRKGLLEGAKLLADLEDEGLDFHWYIGGAPAPDTDFTGEDDEDGVLVEELLDFIEARGWEEERVTLLGRLTMEEQLKLYMNMDLAFFPNKEERFGAALLEAAGLGLPIVATKVGLAEELLKEDKQSLLINELPLEKHSPTFRELEAFLKAMCGLPTNMRTKRKHKRFERVWSQAAVELQQAMI